MAYVVMAYIGMAFIVMAAQEGHAGVAHALLLSGKVDANKPGNDGATPLFIAAQELSTTNTSFLPALVAAHHWLNPSAPLPLLFAAQEGRVHVVRELLESGKVDANLAKRDGVSPLFISVQEGHVDVVEALLKSQKVRAAFGVCDRCYVMLLSTF